MKKILFITLCLTLCLVSCKKRYKCHCTYSSNGYNYDVYEFNKSKKKAISECDKLESTAGYSNCTIQ